MALRGQNLRIQLNTQYASTSLAFIGLAKSCEWNADAQIEDTTTKDTPTGKTEKECTSVERSFSTNHLVIDKDQIDEWENAVGKVVRYNFAHTSGDNNRTIESEHIIRSGAAIVKSCHISAQDRQFATLDIACDCIHVPANTGQLKAPLLPTGEEEQ